MLSEHLFFITERITDILKLREEDESKRILAFPSKIRKQQRITNSIHELHEELSRVVVYLRHVEKGLDEPQHDLDRFYLELCVIANSSDDILTRVISDDVVFNICDGFKCIFSCLVGNDSTSDIYHLVNRIRNSHQLLASGPTYNFNTVGNTNYSGQQIIGSTTINFNPSHSEASMINRISRPKSRGDDPVSDLVGFNHEIQTLLHHLTQDKETPFAGIVGMGGLGKTTLAKCIYQHPLCNKKFTIKVWVCVSQCWDIYSIRSAIYSQVTDQIFRAAMECQIATRVRHKSYLVVVDDMWSIDAWDTIFQALQPWSNGISFVVTSRNKTVPQHIDPTVLIVEPRPLDDTDSWELFKKKAFLSNGNISDALLQLGKEMVKKCGGLPLAIVALAGVLGMDKRPCNWERVSKRLTDNILKANNKSTQGVVKEVLALSYYELPHHLKQCALYLRLFRKDYEINARNLIKMWIAEGLISTEQNQVSTAEEYLDEMVQRYIVEVVKTNFMGQVTRIRIQDLIRQMFVDIDKEKGVLSDSLRLASSTTVYGEQNCNFSDMSQSESIANVERVFLLEPSSHIRSIIFLNHSYRFESVLQSMFVKFRLLRVLILHNIRILPEEIGNLILKRYFELGGHVKQFPKFIENLRNLRTLNIRKLDWKSEAEMNLCKLKELRHLCFPIYSVWLMKLKLEGLEKLKTLLNVRGGEWMLLGMTKLSVVLEELRVRCITSEEQLEVVFKTPSITSYKLRALELHWYVKLRDMNIMRECKSLKKLKLWGEIQAGTDLIFPPNLIKLEMRETYVKEREVMNIISESCPHLEILIFGVQSFKGEELVCNANSFPKLVKLTLYNLKYLRQWIIESTAMPSLHYLRIELCRKLTLTPEGWTRILQIPDRTFDTCLQIPHPTVES